MNFLKNETIRLRALEPEDLEILYRWENDSSIWLTGNTLAPYSRFALRDYIEKTLTEDLYAMRELRLMIVGKNDEKRIGILDMFDFDPFHSRAGIGILVAPEHQSQGIGSQALELFIQYAFHFLKLKQLYCHIPENNLISLALFQKVGFEIAGKLHSWVNTGEGWKDVYVLQLIDYNYSN